jgi:hypothetical protein
MPTSSDQSRILLGLQKNTSLIFCWILHFLVWWKEKLINLERKEKQIAE